jgi:hypothetical protein
MGMIQNSYDKDNVFGATRSSGNGELTELELFVRANEKTGGIILWDEISNMGSQNPDMKEALFKFFYGMLEEGIWTPPSRDEPYDLSKFIFIFTGNDGEKLFQGISADDMRIAIWGMNNKKERIRELLKDLGVPEAFLGRMADLILAKPLTTEVMKKVTLKLVKPILNTFEQKSVSVTLLEEDISQFVESFFSQDMGARSLRNMIDEKLLGWIGQLYILAKKELKNSSSEKINIEIKVHDNLSPKPYSKDRDFNREVKVELIAKDDKGNLLSRLSRDVSEYAPRKIRMTEENAVVTAYHEAGHAVFNDENILGSKIAFITILGADGNLGYARYKERSGDVIDSNLDRGTILYSMARALAGQRAQVLAGFKADSGWESDLKRVNQLAYDYFVKWGDPENHSTLSMSLNKDGQLKINSDLISNELKSNIDSFIKEAMDLADKVLVEKWSAVEAVKNRLLARGEISGPEFYKLLDEVHSSLESKWSLDTISGRVVNKDNNAQPRTRKEIVEQSISIAESSCEEALNL